MVFCGRGLSIEGLLYKVLPYFVICDFVRALRRSVNDLERGYGTSVEEGLFQGGAFAPPIKVFAPPQELVELTY